MKKMPRKYLRYVNAAAEFKQAVQDARRIGSSAPLQERLDSFEDDPFLLYSCLWYAYSQGVTVTFLAPAATENVQK